MGGIEDTIDFNDNSDAENESSSEGTSCGKKRNYHNVLERKRRNHIKDGYVKLLDAVPTIGGKKVSRIQILKKTVEYIRTQEEEIRKKENHFREMGERIAYLRKVVDVIKTKDFVRR